MATGLVTSRTGNIWKTSRIPNAAANNRLNTPRQSMQSAFGRTISNASVSHASPSSSSGSTTLTRRLSDVAHNTPTAPRPVAARTPPSLAAAAAAAANLVAARAAAAERASSGGADVLGTASSDQLSRRVAELEQQLSKAAAAKHKLEVGACAAERQSCMCKMPPRMQTAQHIKFGLLVWLV